MWFDANAALSELGDGRAISAQTPATLATSATKRAHVADVADVAVVAAPPATTATSATPNQRIAKNVAIVATVATPDAFFHGQSVAGNPLTWTGRVVSLAAWRDLTEWERHGSDGRLWSGITQDWEQQKGNKL